MSKLLYIDPICPSGHINFNTIYIETLLKKEIQLDIVCKENYLPVLELTNVKIKLALPNKFYKRDMGGLINRFNILRILLFIKRNIHFNDYDYIIFSSYEEITFYISLLPKNSFLINHNNIGGIDSPIKRFFLRQVAKDNTLIVFEEYIAQKLISYNIKNVIVEPHGLPSKIELNSNSDDPIFKNDTLRKINLNSYSYVIFSPSSYSSDNTLIKEIAVSKRLNNYLEEKNILLILKGNQQIINNKNLIIINQRLSDTDYKRIFKSSNIILIPYPSTHIYRVSAVLFECFSNDKICVLTNILAFEPYKPVFNYSPFFTTLDELITVLSAIINNYKSINGRPFKLEYLKKMKPLFQFIK